ncbi:MAG: FixH family protein [Sulfuricellaceae bacterium]|nr:FixH family protein [Sulfuricellaceae bacterium]
MEIINESSNPWYREPWPWILMSGPAVVVVAGLATAWIAVTTADGMVEDDYYKSGLAINQTLEHDRAAQTLNIKAQLMVGDDPSQVRLMLQGNEQASLPQGLRLKVLHPTRSGYDQEVMLTRQSDGYYEGKLLALAAARWRLTLEDTDQTWRLTGTWRLPKDRVVSLSPGVH